jgi:hypothetical protein
MTGTLAPAAARLLDAIEAGAAAAPVARAVILLGLADPTGDAARHAALPVAERDRRLLDFHAARFGPELVAAQGCASCGETMELPLDASALGAALASADTEIEILAGPDRIAVRQATSADLLAALEADDAEAQEAILLERCVEGPAAAAMRALPEVRAALEQAHAAAELTVAAACPHCGGTQRVALDIATFVWAELRREASLLLDDVDELARAYGWSEAAILALTPARRRAYLDRVRQ